MSDKIFGSHLFGSHLNDSKPRMAGRIPFGGEPFQVSPTDGLNPSPKADGKKIPSVKNLTNEEAK